MKHLVVVLLVSVLCLTSCKDDSPSAGQTPPPSAGAATITLNASVVHQTMTGWEVPVLTTVIDYLPVQPFLDAVMDQAANDLGINKIVIAVTPGAENPSDVCQVQYLNRALTEADFVRNCAYNSVNDNDNPRQLNPNGFHFVLVDWQIDNLLQPLKRKLDARGEKLFVQLRYVDFGAANFEHYQNPDEYAEFLQAVFEHIRDKYGFVPDAIDVMNEPDQVSGWGVAALGPAAVRAGERLASVGFRPDLVAASTVDKGRAASYFDSIMNLAGARDYVKDLSWHCYSDSGANSSAAIAQRALQFGVRTSMTECWHSANQYDLLHRELKESRNSSWHLGPINSDQGYYDVNPTSGQITLRPKARYIRQYYRYIRAGARRIEATSANGTFDPVAFINADGSYVVVVKATAAGRFTIGSLPAGRYGIFQTTGPNPLTVTNYDVTSGDQTIAAGQNVSASINDSGVITIYGKSAATRATLAPSEPSSADPETEALPAANARTSVDLVTRDRARLQLTEWTRGVVDPVDLAFTPEGRLLVAERRGVSVVEADGAAAQLGWTPDDDGTGEQILALAIDPEFASTHFVYTISSIEERFGARTFRLARYREVSGRLGERAILFEGIPAAPVPSAILRFGPDRRLFVALDDAAVKSIGGDLGSINGKILRLNADGSTPRDQASSNPVFSYPYRSPQGLAWNPSSPLLWIADAAPGETARLSVIAMRNGPLTAGIRVRTFALPEGMSPSSLAFFRGARTSVLHNSLLVGSKTNGELLRIQLDASDPTRVIASERILEHVTGGVRTVAMGPDGAIYFGTASSIGRLGLSH